MAMTLAEIRAKLQANEGRKSGESTSGGSDNAIYAHWNIPENTTARLRFLPDGNTANSFFWVERAMIKLPFAGVKGHTDSKPVVVQVPCVEMYGTGENCPILAEVRGWFKDPNLEEMGRKYWKKKSYLFQGFVRENPIGDDKTPANPIRRFVISPQIFNLIKNALMDPEMENLPTDYTGGLDFNVKKTSKGGYADYNTSTWSRKETALTADEQAAIDTHGLYNLSDFLPKKPSDVELKVMKEMFEASVNGEPYDAERWGAYYKPYGLEVKGGATPASVDGHGDVHEAKAQGYVAPNSGATATASPFDADDEPAEATAPVQAAPAKPQTAQDILAQIRNRKPQ
jgi:hypothetical protein